MADEVRGVIATKKGAPVSVETILVPDPGPGEALVRIQACGVCHTDLHYREGAITNDFPFLLGHEASGIVEQVGPNVTNVAPGDFVILAWRAPCGTCRSCLHGRPWYCFASRNARQKMTRQDGTPLSAAIGIGAFAELTLVAAGQAVKVNRDITGGHGVNVAIEAVGKPETYEQAFYARDHAGTVVLVGVPSPDMQITLPLLEVFGRGGVLKSSWYGDCLPTRDFPMFIDLYLQGRLDLERFVSETISVNDVEEAFHKMERGEVLRSVVVF